MMVVSEEVRQAYADAWDHDSNSKYERRSLDFLASRWLSRDDARDILRRYVPSYNEFGPHLLDNLPAKCQVRIARDYSVAIYVKGAKRLPSMSKMVADNKYETELDGVQCVRYWWD